MRFRDELTGETMEITPSMANWLKLADAMDEVGGDAHTDQKRFDSRGKLFAEVDRQIKARVDLVVPNVIRVAQKKIDSALDADKIAEAANKHRAWVNEKLREQRATFDATVHVLVDDALRNIAAHQVDDLARRVKRAMGSVVAKEVGLQLARFLKPAQPAKPAKKKRKARK